LAIMGPSGAGKTTLLMLMAGLERASSGSVRVADRDLSAMGEDDLAAFRRENVGIVFQGFHLVPAMTALENAALPLEFAGRADAFARAAEALVAVGLGTRLGHFPAELSGGEQQRVALARALAPRPRLILADEPTGNLDGETGERVMELLFSLAADTTLVLVTHDPGLAGRCGRVVRMRDGQVADSGMAAG
jgi:putative ABC transport system ATP-binding protein